jgi:hypothetical protein
MALQLTIGGSDYTSYVDFHSLMVQDSVRAKGDACSFDVVLPLDDAGAPPRPQGSQEVALLDRGVKEFGGVISRVRQTLHGGPRVLRYSVSCVDYTPWLDRRLVNMTLASQLVGDMVIAVIVAADPYHVFTFNNINASSITLQEQTIEYEMPSSVLDRLAQMVEHQWYVDYDRDVHFFPRELNAAPLSTLDLDADYESYWGFEWEEDVSQVHTVIYVKDFKVAVSNDPDGRFHESWKGDGLRRFFPLYNMPGSLSGFSVSVNGTPYTIRNDAEGEDGNPGQAFVCLDNWGVRFPSSDIPPSGSTIEVAYPAYGTIRAVEVDDPEAMARMKAREGNADGAHEFLASLPDRFMPSAQAAEEWGRLILDRYKEPIETVRFSTLYKGASTRWRAGQHLRVVSATRGIDRIYFVSSVTKRVRVPAATGPGAEPVLEYNIEATSTVWGL